MCDHRYLLHINIISSHKISKSSDSATISKVPKNNPRLLHSTDWNGMTQIQITLDIMHKTTRTAKARAIQIQIKSIIWVSAHRVTFHHALIEGTVCVTTVHHAAAKVDFLYICSSFHIFAILRLATGSQKEVQYPQTHAVYSSIYY